ncbi:MAG TPA: hypothetical protein VIM73_20910 [Polyangiaceae bacterium]
MFAFHTCFPSAPLQRAIYTWSIVEIAMRGSQASERLESLRHTEMSTLREITIDSDLRSMNSLRARWRFGKLS